MSIWDTIIAPVEHVIDKVIPDRAANDAAKAELERLRETDYAQQIADDVKVQVAGLEVVKAEAQGESWLQKNWRPITALVFVWLVVSYFYGLVAPNLSAALVLEIFGLIKICLGGYTIGRTGEKIAQVIPSIVTAVKR
jgi:uncharacterized membrane protein